MVLSKSLGFAGYGETLTMLLSDVYCRRPVRRSELQGEKSHSLSQEDNKRPPSFQIERISAAPFIWDLVFSVSLWRTGTDSVIWIRKKAISKYRDGCTHYCRNHFKYLRWVALYAPKLHSYFTASSAFYFLGQGWCSERNRVHFGLPVQQELSHQTYLTRNASRTGSSHSAVWWCSAPDRNLLRRSLHTDFLALVPNQISRSSKSEGQVPSQPSKTQRVPPCWQARGETENAVQYA